ncbi:MAG: hypothetical protein KJ600_04830 [Nanoarchaeota archaeon]|nr:hypothetical protein [Nanoarchaeota archaeon]MBU1103854.1 hypothetical protein [Nanoarchaeota archaeon]
MEILQDTKNPLLKRKEIKFSIKTETNPGIQGCMEKVVEKFKVPEEHVVVRSVKNNFGSQEFVCEVFIYDSKEDKEKIEPKQKVKKKGAKK